MSQFKKYLDIIQESYLKINGEEVSNLNTSFWEDQMNKTLIKVEKEGKPLKYVNISIEDWKELEKGKFNVIPSILKNSFILEVDPKNPDPKNPTKKISVKSLSEINRNI